MQQCCSAIVTELTKAFRCWLFTCRTKFAVQIQINCKMKRNWVYTMCQIADHWSNIYEILDKHEIPPNNEADKINVFNVTHEKFLWPRDGSALRWLQACALLKCGERIPTHFHPSGLSTKFRENFVCSPSFALHIAQCHPTIQNW